MPKIAQSLSIFVDSHQFPFFVSGVIYVKSGTGCIAEPIEGIRSHKSLQTTIMKEP